MLKKAYEKYGGKDWKLIAKDIPGRTPNQCSQRWRRI